MNVLRFFTKLSLLLLTLSLSIWACQADVKSITDTQKKDLRDTIDSLRLLGNIAIHQDYNKARAYYMDGLVRGIPVLGYKDNLVLRLFHNIGSAYYNEGLYDLAYSYFDSTAISQPNPPIEWIKALNDFRIGQCHLMRNENDLAKSYFVQSLMNAPNHKNSRLFLSDILNNYATTNRRDKLFDEAIHYLQEAIDSNLLKRRDDTIQLADSYNIMSSTYQDKKDYVKAIEATQKAIALYEKANMSEYIMRTRLNLGELYRRNGKHILAEQTLSKTLNDAKAIKTDAKLISGLHINRGEVYADQKLYNKALADYDSSMFYLTRNFQINTEGGHLSELETEQYKRSYLMSALTDAALARTQLLDQGDTRQQPFILATYKAITELTEMIRRDYLSEDAKLNLSADVKPILEKAFAFSRPLNNGVEQAFMISEQSKSMTLLEAVRLNNRDFSNRGNAQEVKEIQNRLASLKMEKIEIEKKLVNVSPNSTEVRQFNTDLTKKIADERSERLKFNVAIRVATANDTLVSIANIQNKLLESDQALLEYFMQGDSILNIFCLTQNAPIVLKTIHLPKNFTAMLASITAAATPDGMRQKEVCENAYKLYQLLIETIAKEKKLPNRLIIVAEYPLSNLPFDVLLTQPATDYNKAVADGLPLLFKHALSYSYSANLLWEMRFLNKNNGQKGISAFAPAFPKKMNADNSYMNLALQSSFPFLTSLQNAKEVQNIGNNAELYLNDKATKEAFKDACRHSNVLHIATHCIVNYTNPDFNYISFSQNSDTLNRNALFYLKDLYANPMPLDLAVFSACQSAIGKEIKGEAPLSMARGLAYAGVRSFITTQWFVNTDKNADFYKFFYAALAKGMSKDVALQDAKKQFINYAEGNSDPYFWASMMLIGNTEPIDFQANRNDFWWAILGLTIVVSGFLFWRKRK